MSFLDNIKTNKPGVGSGVNPFATGAMKANNSNPFAAKTTSAPAAAAPANPFNIAATPAATGVVPKAGAVKKPAAPTSIPTSAPKGVPTTAAPKSPVMPSVPTPVAPVVEEKAKDVSTEEIVKDMQEMTVEEPKVEAPVEEKVETAVKEEVAEPVKEEAVTEVKEEKKTRSRKTSSRKKTTKTVTEDVIDAPTEADLVETLFKMPSTTVKYAEAIQAIKSKFVDEEWEAFRKEIIAESDDIVIESDMQEGAMKKTIAKLNALREKVWVNFVDTKALFESLSNKDTEGLIERVKFASLEGTNETSRKKAGVLAVMNYVTPEGEKINLYEVYDETKNRFYFLRSVMDTIKYKSDVLITMSSAIKMEKGHTNN